MLSPGHPYPSSLLEDVVKVIVFSPREPWQVWATMDAQGLVAAAVNNPMLCSLLIRRVGRL